MDVTTAAWGVLAGVLGTVAMTAIEVVAHRRWGLAGLLEWQENQVLAARLLDRRAEDLTLPGIAFHFLHGALAGLAFVLIVTPLGIPGPSLVIGAGFGFVLFLITLVIHRPLTGVRPFGGDLGLIPASVSLVGHLAYGIALGLLVGSA